jgi:uncharacterized damage-inducible protein DinB
MFTTLEQFIATWEYESAATQHLLDALTDDSLAQAIAPGHRTIGRIAWHLAQTLVEMPARTGLTIEGLGEHDPVPTSAAAIAAAYRTASASLITQLRTHWTDATLEETDDMYGERWSRGRTLDVILFHQAHHRGQLTVLMRQAGLPVHGVYGPSKDEWGEIGAPAPEV